MNTYETINDILVHLFNEIWELEEKAIISEEFKDITNNDMHIIEAIGLGAGDTMSAIAKKLNVTAGTLTTSMNRLVRQDYVVRQRSTEDRRVVMITLTEKGERAYRHHAKFHEQMTDAVIQSLEPEELPVLLKTLNGLAKFFRNYND
ncbi:MAG: MarR family transcriptional regulator [Dorea phocaeensis]